MADKVAIVLHSGTLDKLHAAATLTTGAVAMGREVHLFLTFWGLEAFLRDRIDTEPPMSSDAGPNAERVTAWLRESELPPWKERLEQASMIGEINIHACSMTMDALGLEEDDLDPMIDDVLGVATFFVLTGGADLLFI